jgi:hypothetical protein
VDLRAWEDAGRFAIVRHGAVAEDEVARRLSA